MASHVRLAIKIVLLVGIFILLWIFAEDLADQIHRIEAFIRDQGPMAPLFFTLALLILPLIFFPLDPLCFAAGVLFGFTLGSIYAVFGLLASASLMFLMSRYLARDPLSRYFSKKPKMQKINQLVSGGGVKIMLMLRILPLPFSPLSYYLGVTRVGFSQYFWSIFGTMGTVLLGVYTGSVAQKLAKLDHSPWHFIALGLGFLVMMIVVGYTRKSIKAEEAKLPKNK